MHKHIKQGLVGVAFSLAAVPVFAQSETSNLEVGASVSNNCTIDTTAVSAGSYDPIVGNKATPLDSQSGKVTITCTQGTSATIGLDVGANSANATGVTRAMSDGAGTPSYLSYELYQASDHVTVWTNIGGGLLAPEAAPSSEAREYTVFARIPADQDVPAGTYGDTVVATVNF